ncbi:unnamed protein product [Cylindrotheca closterium]|uniref:SET domain-containing protein n=1 Tax=Cylindrotheca closterium TaxID=2856 RepID=A0AAD2JGX5_9STRA|nr:unnamed protein product [Cylindrotheca closterium]
MTAQSFKYLFCSICLFSLQVNAFITTWNPAGNQHTIQTSTTTRNNQFPDVTPTLINQPIRSTATRLFESASLMDLLDTLEDKRDIPSLQDWAVEQGVHFAEGVLLVDNGLGDWGVGLSANHSHVANTPIMTIPPHLILSSQDARIAPATQSFIENKMATISPGMDYYHKECLLMMVVLLETFNAASSNWSPWLETLPRSFSIGLFLDPLERSHVGRMAPAFLEQQDKQWNACWNAIQQVVDDELVELPIGFRDYLRNYMMNEKSSSSSSSEEETADDERTLKELVQWAFGVVFTRSWRSPDGKAATLVPLGDMFNHDSSMANVFPSLLQQNDDDDESLAAKMPEGSIQMKLKQNVEVGSPLFISYGMGDQPARFLVNFGFWDRSASLMDANLTVPNTEDWIVDPSELVVSTRSGGVSEEVWNLAAYKFLLLNEQNAMTATKLAQARKDNDQASFQAILDDYDIPAIMYLRKHALQIISETYPDMDLCPEGNPIESPRRFGMIARYNNGMRESWMRVAESLEFELEDALAKRQEGR